MSKIFEAIKIDVGLAPVSLASTNATSPYFSLAITGRPSLFGSGSNGNHKDSKAGSVSGQRRGGRIAKLLTGAAATITANVNVRV